MQNRINISFYGSKRKDWEQRNELQLETVREQKPVWVLSKKADVLLKTRWNLLPCLHPLLSFCCIQISFLAILVVSTGQLEDWQYLEGNTTQICQFGEEIPSSEYESPSAKCAHISLGQADLVSSWRRSAFPCLVITLVLNRFISTVRFFKEVSKVFPYILFQEECPLSIVNRRNMVLLKNPNIVRTTFFSWILIESVLDCEMSCLFLEGCDFSFWMVRWFFSTFS